VRRYDDPVEVRTGADEDPDQFLWRGRLWQVREVVAHWVETGPWWQSSGVRAVIGSDEPGDPGWSSSVETQRARTDLLSERELWRVEAGHPVPGGEATRGGFGPSFDWADGHWQLVGCVD